MLAAARWWSFLPRADLKHGAAFFEEAAGSLAAANEFRRTPTGRLRLGACEAAAHVVLVPIVRTFMRRYPDMRVDIVTGAASSTSARPGACPKA